MHARPRDIDVSQLWSGGVHDSKDGLLILSNGDDAVDHLVGFFASGGGSINHHSDAEAGDHFGKTVRGFDVSHHGHDLIGFEEVCLGCGTGVTPDVIVTRSIQCFADSKP